MLIINVYTYIIMNILIQHHYYVKIYQNIFIFYYNNHNQIIRIHKLNIKIIINQII